MQIFVKKGKLNVCDIIRSCDDHISVGRRGRIAINAKTAFKCGIKPGDSD